jgi:hypothetical protein
MSHSIIEKELFHGTRLENGNSLNVGQPDVTLYGPPQARNHQQRPLMALAAQKRRPPIAKSFRKKFPSKVVTFDGIWRRLKTQIVALRRTIKFQ